MQHESDDNLKEIATVIGITRSVPDNAASSEALDWVALGFDDPDEILEWINAGCANPSVARTLEDAGITPAQAAFVPESPSTEGTETIAQRISAGTMVVEAARRIVTSHFWNK